MKIFRKLRIEAVQLDSAKRYLLYAVGEIVLIVVGILIAVNINNWNERNKSLKLQLKTLKEIKAALLLDVADLRLNIELHQEAIRACGALLEVFKKDQNYHDTLSYYFAKAFWSSRFISKSGPYETLKSRGIELITNDDLRNEITDVYDRAYENLLKVEGTMADYIQHVMLSFNPDHFDKTEMFSATHPESIGIMKPMDFEKLKENKKYHHLLRTFRSSSELFVTFNYQSTIEMTEKLIASIEREIAQLE
ncbi:DUF6090 family protein [Fulvivirgaceae bacterium BMA10]|uniref:DUF6090 family protein n=1 Tax=Splendidivirga corallicola TaxID=3051826 RepID=A0ABT8KIM3_9BACT|nr:DUF6090 family protein [Fulvivirgaceae bacterium BMA10]